MTIRVLVCGGRDYPDRRALYTALDSLHASRPFAVVITGGAHGADMLARDWASYRCVPTEIYVAEWSRFGRKGGPIRNKQMLTEGRPDLVLAFPGGRGTANMIAQATRAGIEVINQPALSRIVTS